MAFYGLSFQATPAWNATATFTPAWDVVAASTNRPAVVEIGVSQYAAPASALTLAIGRSSTASVQLAPTAPIAEIPTDKASVTSIATAWSTAPGLPVQYLRRTALAANAGMGVIWTWRRGLVIPASGGLNVVFQAAAITLVPLTSHVVVNE